jgi:hypothetical protein
MFEHSLREMDCGGADETDAEDDEMAGFHLCCNRCFSATLPDKEKPPPGRRGLASIVSKA